MANPSVVLDESPEEAVDLRQAVTAEDARWYARVGPWTLGSLYVAACLMLVLVFLGTPATGSYVGLTNLTESYGALERVGMWQRSLTWLPGIGDDGIAYRLPTGVIAYGARLALVLMFVGQGWAFWLAWRGTTRSLWTWLAGPLIGHVVMLLLVPTNADVFFYEMSADLANNGFNPYVYPLMDFPDHPLLPYNHWVEMTAVYGPLWTTIGRGLMAVTGPDPFAATIAFKLATGATAIGLAIVVHRFAKYLTGSHSLAIAAAVLVAWQPNMLIESTGQAHNDMMMVLLATGGVAVAVIGGIGALRGALVLVIASALVKYVTLPVLGVLGLVRLVERRQRGLPRVLLDWIVDGVAILAVSVACFAPYWAGFSTLREVFLEPGRLFTNPLWFDPYIVIQDVFPSWISRGYARWTRRIMQVVAFALLGWAMLRFVRSLWSVKDDDAADERDMPAWTRPVLVTFAVVLSSLALIPVNSHPWYWTWPIAPIALLVTFDAGRARSAQLEQSNLAVPRWLWGYVVLTAVLTLAYHTRIVHL